MASRLAIAEGLGIDESRLRAWERAGILPAIDEIGEVAYLARARMIAAARDGGVTLRQIRRGLGAVGGVHATADG